MPVSSLHEALGSEVLSHEKLVLQPWVDAQTSLHHPSIESMWPLLFSEIWQTLSKMLIHADIRG